MTDTKIEIPDHVRTVRLQRRVDGEPQRVFRAWGSPDALATWFPDNVDGSLAVDARSTLVFPSRRVWCDVLVVQPDELFQFRWPWLDSGDLVTTVTVTVTPRGYGSVVTLEDGPFDLTVPGVLDAYTHCLSGWGKALANLRAVIDFSVDLRRYRSG
jgi:uncharacterized protein YndB with AHSA1/START domain